MYARLMLIQTKVHFKNLQFLAVTYDMEVLKGTYQGFSFFIANSFYMSDLMYLLRIQIILHNVQ